MSSSASSIPREGDHPPGQYRALSVVQTTPSQQMATAPLTPTQHNTSTNTPPQAPRRTSSLGSVPLSTSRLMGTIYPTASYTGPSLGFNTNITLGNSPYVPTGLQTGGLAVSAANLPKIPPMSLQIVRANDGCNLLRVQTIHRTWNKPHCGAIAEQPPS
ncbi:hypothetical protein C8Q74DRAFT_1222169 [Fomes fomentarius]|nr:hypothetical protein C8Q74DRAFT_1222169 [Fomes fomentarius]